VTGERHPQGVLHVAFAPPLDVRASLAPLGRAGDDLIDRFDGITLLRTVRIGPDDKVVAFAAAVAADTGQPSVVLRLAPTTTQWAEAVAAALRASLLTDRAALAELALADERVADLARRNGGIVAVLFGDPFTALVRSISAQQVNLRWAATVRARLAQRYGTRHRVEDWSVWSLDPEPIARAQLVDLRTNVQLTGAKSVALIGCAGAALAGELRLADLAALTDDQLIAHLTGLRGIGRWSAEWFLARTLGRPRVVAGDLGVRKAIGRLYGTPAIPSELEVRRLTEHWGAAASHAQALALHDLALSQGPPGR
jgi:DNA-3-methyladenine glycosylase II